jgi:hypothetical protein
MNRRSFLKKLPSAGIVAVSVGSIVESTSSALEIFPDSPLDRDGNPYESPVVLECWQRSPKFRKALIGSYRDATALITSKEIVVDSGPFIEDLL